MLLPTMYDDIDTITTKPQLGHWLRSRIDALGLRVEDLAKDLSGVSQATIYNWLNGRNLPKPPKADGIDRFYLLISHPDLGLDHRQRLALDRVRERLTSEATVDRRRRPLRGLPADIVSFSGREAELRRLDRLLTTRRRSSTVVVSAVSGMGGVGKTALAVRWAHRKPVLDTFADGFLYIDLHGFGATPPLEPRSTLHQLLLKLGSPPGRIPDDVEAMAALYQQTLETKTLLLILDNARDEAQVRPLLPRNADCLAMVTSRHHLAGLKVSHDAIQLHLDQLSPRESAALLATLMDAGGVNPPSADTMLLAQRCAHLPLALRIAAAAYLTSDVQTGVTVAEYAATLAQGRISELAASATDPSTAVRSVMDSSYRRLEPELRRALLLLARHPGSDYDVSAAAAILDVPLEQAADLLARLHQLSLVETVDGEPGAPSVRHRMHDLLVGYAQRHPDLSTTDADAAIQRLRDQQLHAALTAGNLLYPFDADRRPTLEPTAVALPRLTCVKEAAAWLDAERANLLTVAMGSVHPSPADHVGRLAIILFRYLDTSCHWQEAVRLHAAAFDTGTGPDRGRAANQLAITYENLGNHARARDYARHAIAIARRHHRIIDECTAVSTLARVYLSLSLYRRAAGLYRHTLRLARSVDHSMYAAWSLSNLGVATLRSTLDKTATAEYFRQAAELNEQNGSTAGLGIALGNLGLALEHQGRLPEALEHSRRGLRLADELQDGQQQVRLMANIGRILGKVGDLDGAMSYLDRALTRARELRLSVLECNTLNNLAVTHVAAGRHDAAHTAAAQALTLARELEDRLEQAISHQVIGTVLHHGGDHSGGVDHHDQAERLATDACECNLLAEIHDAVGQANADHDPARARVHWGKAVPMFRQMNPDRADTIEERLRRLEDAD